MGERSVTPVERGDARQKARRDLRRMQRRPPPGRFWRSVALIGSVGWPIVLLATGGALLGRFLDRRWETGVRFSLMLVAIGAAVGTWMAFRSLRRDG